MCACKRGFQMSLVRLAILQDIHLLMSCFPQFAHSCFVSWFPQFAYICFVSYFPQFCKGTGCACSELAPQSLSAWHVMNIQEIHMEEKRGVGSWCQGFAYECLLGPHTKICRTESHGWRRQGRSDNDASSAKRNAQPSLQL